jgi:hypothetical protein
MSFVLPVIMVLLPEPRKLRGALRRSPPAEPGGFVQRHQTSKNTVSWSP